MTTIELYIDGRLCDIKEPEKLGIRLNRVLINPAELNTKDAQYSYSVSLPSTPLNDILFGYSNVEEVKDKFNTDYPATLIVNSVPIFDGRFRLSEITSGAYKGNLIVPAQKTIKEIFGDKKMTETGNGEEWNINFIDMVSGINQMNTDAGVPDCIFPFVLYGLLPKLPENEEGDNYTYTAKNSWDEYVRLGIENFPPSINCLQTIRQLFGKNGYQIKGNAFEDERLINLYMSYQNPSDYRQEWNWGHLGKIALSGKWDNRKPKTNGSQNYDYEKFGYVNDDAGLWRQYGVNLFGCSMLQDLQIDDKGTNVLYNNTTENLKQEGETADRKHVHITVPYSGLYKIELSASLELQMDAPGHPILPKTASDADTGLVFISGENSSYFGSPIKANNFSNSRYELKLLRDFGDGDFGLTELKADGDLYEKNLPQNRKSSTVFYFPFPDTECVQMIDPVQNEKLVCGFRWGDLGDTQDGVFYNSDRSARNPLEYFSPSDEYAFSRIMAIKNGWSWDKSYAQKNKVFSAIHNPQGYAKLRKIEEDVEAEEYEIDFNGYLLSTTGKFRMVVDEGSSSYKENEISNTLNAAGIKDAKGSGHLSQVVWLEKGEHLTLVAVSDAAYANGKKGWMDQHIEFDLQIEPFKKSTDWIKADSDGNGTAAMDWNSPSDFKTETIDLFKFLPSEVKTDEWLNSFCKAFNLKLTQPSGNLFELNIVQTMQRAVNSVLDISGKASVLHRSNLPLELPSAFELGFKINKDEQGYISDNEDGGGRFETAAIAGKPLSQSSGFSYNWYASLLKDGTAHRFPIITNKEIWDTEKNDYAEMMKKSYTNYSQRFWYRTGNQSCIGALWDNLGDACVTEDRKNALYLPILANTFDDGHEKLQLSYKNQPDTLLQSFFNIIATNDSNYTEVECYLLPEEYERMDGSTLIRFNDDLYYVASVDGYDPLNRNKAKLRLIRKVE
ncbi:hypothetical protein [Viscerimonas tarda]